MLTFVGPILAVESSRSGIPARWVYACRIEAFDTRQIVGVSVDGLQLVIIRDGDCYFAAERACPHEGADLAQGRCIGARLHCPRHLAWFDCNKARYRRAGRFDHSMFIRLAVWDAKFWLTWPVPATKGK